MDRRKRQFSDQQADARPSPARAVALALCLAAVSCLAWPSESPALGADAVATVVCPSKASALEVLAAREVQRYVYLRTGQLLPIVVSARPPRRVTVYWRPMGQGKFAQIPPEYVARSTYTFRLPPASGTAFEYYVGTVIPPPEEEEEAVWPRTMLRMNQTQVVCPQTVVVTP